MYVDYLIVGQGIAGTFLCYYLIRAGKKVIVIDEYNPATASRVASGIINPVTGRRVVTTWMIDELLPFAQNAYSEIGAFLNCTPARDIEIINFHATEQMQAAWHDRVAEGADYISHINTKEAYTHYFNAPYGAGLTTPCLLADLNILLPAWRQYLRDTGGLVEERFAIEDMVANTGDIQYGDITAKKVLLCNGIDGFTNTYFHRLPYSLNKGEALIAEIPGLPRDVIYKQGMNIVPYGQDTFWIGSSFEWEFQHPGPTDVFRQNVEDVLAKWLKTPYKILEHKASIRPASLERRPFVGLHPLVPSVGILNGMGTKGCSLAPYFAYQLAMHLTDGATIHPHADITRFKKSLSIQ